MSCSRAFLGAAYLGAGQLRQCPQQGYSQGAAGTSALCTQYWALAKLNLAGFPETPTPLTPAPSRNR